jgi:hypothetical protein
VPKDLVDEAAQGLAQPGALSATLNWYRAVDDDLYVLAGEVCVPTLYIWGENDMALGEDAAMRKGFRQSTLSIRSPGWTCALASQ